jgi:hypothetical protein
MAGDSSTEISQVFRSSASLTLSAMHLCAKLRDYKWMEMCDSHHTFARHLFKVMV